MYNGGKEGMSREGTAKEAEEEQEEGREEEQEEEGGRTGLEGFTVRTMVSRTKDTGSKRG